MANMIRHYAPRGARLLLDFSVQGEGVTLPYRTKKTIREAIEETLFYERCYYDTEVSFTLCNNDVIRELNRTYRKKDAATDVLSFPLYLPEELKELPKDEPVPLGDIVLSGERAAMQARELGHSTLREIAFLCIHSTLHLLGYDHERGAEEEEDMCRRQREIIEKLKIEE